MLEYQRISRCHPIFRFGANIIFYYIYLHIKCCQIQNRILQQNAVRYKCRIFDILSEWILPGIFSLESN